MSLSAQSGSTADVPVVILVTVEIQPDRLEEFRNVMEIDAVGSMTRENGGCLRFDVLESASQPNKFYFYEVYKNAAAVDAHKASEHFAKWTAFKASGGVISQVAEKPKPFMMGDRRIS